MSLWSRLTSGIAGFGVGAATADTVTPVLEPLKQTAWRNSPAKVLSPGQVAEAEVKGFDTAVDLPDDAAREGIGPARYALLKELSTTFPGLAQVMELQRRTIFNGTADTAGTDFNTALQRLGYDPTYSGFLAQLLGTLLSPEVMAQAIQQGHVPDDNVLTGLPTPTFIPANYPAHTAPDGQPPTTVPLTQIAIDPIEQAAGSGTSLEQLQVLANLAGLPPAQELLLTLWNRNLVDEAAVDSGLREGHLKTKWADAFKRLRWSVLSHIQYVDARVRGWITNEQMYEGGALSGFTSDQMDMLHRTHGRPISWHQVWIGLQRGGKILDPTADLTAASLGIDDTFFKALQQSDIQQQWYDLAWAQRYSYPSAFVLRQLAESGAIDPPTLTQTLTYIGWEPTFVEKVVTAWTGGGATTATQKKQTLAHLTAEYLSGALSEAALTNVLTTSLGYTAQQAADEIALANFNAAKSARTKATKNLEKRYIGVQLSDAAARTALAGIGWPAGAIDQFLASWAVERADTLTTLTVGNITTALKNGTILASEARPLLQELGESDAAIATLFQTYGTDPNT